MRRFTNFFRRTRTRVLVAGGAAVVALGGGITVGALTAASSSASTASASAPTTTVPATPSTVTPSQTGASGKAKTKGKGHVLRGTITAISGNTWTLQTKKGKSVTVEITTTTKFAKRLQTTKPVVGTDVAIVFSRQGSTITATAVGLAHTKTTTPSTSTTLPNQG